MSSISDPTRTLSLSMVNCGVGGTVGRIKISASNITVISQRTFLHRSSYHLIPYKTNFIFTFVLAVPSVPVTCTLIAFVFIDSIDDMLLRILDLR